MNTEKHKDYMRRYYQEHRDTIRKQQKEYKDSKPDYQKEYRRRTGVHLVHASIRRERQFHGTDSMDRLLSRLYRQAINNDVCFYCRKPGEQVDHFYPIAKGGTERWYNLVKACAHCNLSKGAHCGTWYLLRSDYNQD